MIKDDHGWLQTLSLSLPLIAINRCVYIASTPPPVRGAFVDLSYGIIHRKMPTFVYFHHMRCCCSISRDDLIFLFEFTFIIAWSAVGLE